mmetsp:Transcript_32660/g.28919  ORF Transcript_32660/g.28919 Transcript_32660/m.28919 type:complete len:139 (+) Transcript_32660:518-934(+)
MEKENYLSKELFNKRADSRSERLNHFAKNSKSLGSLLAYKTELKEEPKFIEDKILVEEGQIKNNLKNRQILRRKLENRTKISKEDSCIPKFSISKPQKSKNSFKKGLSLKFLEQNLHNYLHKRRNADIQNQTSKMVLY